MILPFVISLFATLFITRLIAHKYHDSKNYGTKKEKSKTITGLLRRYTGINLHHIHFGLLLIILCSLSIALKSPNKYNVIILGIGISWVLDQISPLIDKKSNYFSHEKLSLSITLHLIVSGIAALINFF